MQAIHSLTVGVDATLEEATRTALDQTAAFTLFDALQFLAFRVGNVFDLYGSYHLLGQGTIRAAIAGKQGKSGEAFLLVHAGPASPAVVNGLNAFIREITRQGSFFPLTSAQFRGLIDQTEEERTGGFGNHQRYGEFFDWRLNDVVIPQIIESFPDWARVELVSGIPFSLFPEERKREVAQRVISAAQRQLTKWSKEGTGLINPEFHAGNLLVGEGNELFLVDCGLTGEIAQGDVMSLLGTLAAFRQEGLVGAAAFFMRPKIKTLGEINPEKREEFLSSLGVIERQISVGAPPELLLPSLASVALRAVGMKPGSGLETLFRALQHLAPYFRLSGGASSSLLAALPKIGDLSLTAEIREALSQNSSTVANRLPRGLTVGKRGKDRKIISLGVLAGKARDLFLQKMPANVIIYFHT